MAYERSSGQQQRAMIMMFRPRFDRIFPASRQDAAFDQEMLAILEKADRRRIVSAPKDEDET